eukprot:m.58467 g.58467  ORF g.58467 m.58467 type:complete len:99 (+) comp7864_c1_seq1:2526-2822(+)
MRTMMAMMHTNTTTLSEMMMINRVESCISGVNFNSSTTRRNESQQQLLLNLLNICKEKRSDSEKTVVVYESNHHKTSTTNNNIGRFSSKHLVLLVAVW